MTEPVSVGLYLGTSAGWERRGWPSNPWQDEPDPDVVDPLIVPPDTITLTPTPEGFTGTWNNVPAPAGNFGKYEWQPGNGSETSVEWVSIRSSGFEPRMSIGGLAASIKSFRVRAVTVKGRVGEWSEVKTVTPLPPVVVEPPSGNSRNLGHPFWTTPLAVDCPLAPTSADYSRRLELAWLTRPFKNGAPQPGMSPVNGWTDVPYNTNVNPKTYALPTYRVPMDQPLRTVFSIKHKYRSGSGVDLDDILEQGVPLPTPSLLPNGRIASPGTDASCIIIRGYEAWEFIGLLSRADATAAGTSFQRPEMGRYVEDRYEYRCTQAGYIEDIRTHPGWWSSPPDFGVSAAGHSYLGTALKYEDWVADDINHPLGLTLSVTGSANGSPRFILPATRGDVGNFTNSSATVNDIIRIPEGSRFRLKHSFDIDSWARAKARSSNDFRQGSDYETLHKSLRCARWHGVIINDRAGGVMGISIEGQQVYGTPYGPGPSTMPVWGNFAVQWPWHAFEQVKVPPRDISVYGGDANVPSRTPYNYARLT